LLHELLECVQYRGGRTHESMTSIKFGAARAMRRDQVIPLQQMYWIADAESSSGWRYWNDGLIKRELPCMQEEHR
jgi:hypothetical protein